MRLAILALYGVAGCVSIPPDVAETFAPPAPQEANNYGARGGGAAAARASSAPRASATAPPAPSPVATPAGGTTADAAAAPYAVKP